MVTYKCCVVPQCISTTIKTPEKLFVPVPMNPKKRKRWLKLAHRTQSISDKSNVYMCEDHFNMEKDVANYMKFKMGFAKKLLVMNGALPSKFYCQKGRHKRPRKKREVVKNDSPLLISEESIKIEDEIKIEQVIKEEPLEEIGTNEDIVSYEFVAIKLEQQLDKEKTIKDEI